MAKEFTILVVGETTDEAAAVRIAEAFQRVGMGLVLSDGAQVAVKMKVQEIGDDGGESAFDLPPNFSPGDVSGL